MLCILKVFFLNSIFFLMCLPIKTGGEAGQHTSTETWNEIGNKSSTDAEQ